VFYTNIGSGIGGGLVKNGELYVGHLGAMEFGHTWTFSELEGRWDIVENLCSGWAIGRRARQMVGEAADNLLVQLSDGQLERIDARLVAEAWQRGDAIACRLMDDMVRAFSRALANVVALLNPDTIVIGGGVALVGEPLFRALRHVTLKYAFAPFTKNFTIEPASLGERCVPVGALLMAARYFQATK
jgi:glucokinase